MRYSDSCGGVAGVRKTLRYPRRDDEPTEFYFCSDECEADKVEQLERTAQYARLVN